MNDWLLVAVHKKVRELHAKVLLSCVAVERGFNVVLGRTGDIRDQMDILPRGVFVGVTFGPTRDGLFSEYKRYGNLVAAFDEEATAIDHWEFYKSLKISKTAITNTDLLFAWGQVHADMITEEMPESSNKVVVSGHPRYDLLRTEVRGIFQAQVEEIQARYAPYILINSNVDPYVLDKAKVEEFWQKYLRRKQLVYSDKEEFLARVEYKRRNHEAMIDLVPHLAKAFPDHTILVRPKFTSIDHPWTKTLDTAAPNIKVIHEGNVAPWILGSDSMLMRDCTTGIEGFLLDKPVLSYQFFSAEDYGFDSYLPTALGHSVYSVDEAVAELERIIIKRESESIEEVQSRRQIAERHIGGLNDQLASERITEALAGLDIPDESEADTQSKINNMYRTDKIQRPFQLAAALVREQVLGRRNNVNYISLEEIQKILSQLKTTMGRFEQIQVRELNKSRRLFLLSQR